MQITDELGLNEKYDKYQIIEHSIFWTQQKYWVSDGEEIGFISKYGERSTLAYEKSSELTPTAPRGYDVSIKKRFGEGFTEAVVLLLKVKQVPTRRMEAFNLKVDIEFEMQNLFRFFNRIT